MSLTPATKVIPLIIATMLLASCQIGGSSNSGTSVSRAGFKNNYIVARTALEGGDYAKASRQYASLLRKAGPLEARLRLEYAHALLRDGKYRRASDEAKRVALALQGPGRSAALAVQGTADQEIARAAIARGRAGANAADRLIAARAAFDEMLANHPELDPLGAMAQRRAVIDQELAAIR